MLKKTALFFKGWLPSDPWMSWQSFCDESCFHVELGLFLLYNGIFFNWLYLCIVFLNRLNDCEWLATYKEFSRNILHLPSQFLPTSPLPSWLTMTSIMFFYRTLCPDDQIKNTIRGGSRLKWGSNMVEREEIIAATHKKRIQTELSISNINFWG